jgi:hypothetical protein
MVFDPVLTEPIEGFEWKNLLYSGQGAGHHKPSKELKKRKT